MKYMKKQKTQYVTGKVLSVVKSLFILLSSFFSPGSCVLCLVSCVFCLQSSVFNNVIVLGKIFVD